MHGDGRAARLGPEPRYSEVMQFDMAWIYGGASLADPYWVSGALLWGALLAKLALRSIQASGLRRLPALSVVAVAILGAHVGTHVLANLLQVPAGVSNSYSWGPFWIALPIGAVMLVFRLAQPAVDRCLSLARSLAALNCIHAVWAMMFFPGELFRTIEPYTRPGFETIVVTVPSVAISGLLALLAIQIAVGDGGRAKGWRAWFSARLQLAVSALVLLVQIHILDIAAFPYFERPFPIETFAFVSGSIMGMMAFVRIRS